MQQIFSYSEFPNVEEKAGCYSLFLDWTRIRKSDFESDLQKRADLINAIFRVYTPNPIFLNAHRQFFDKKQNFGETYSGDIKYDDIRSINLPSQFVENFEVFLAFLDFVKTLIIPLYIGKSKNLNRRLKQHRDYLTTQSFGTSYEIDIEEIERFKNFSDRFSSILKENKLLGLRTSMLSARIVYLKDSEITEFETNLNYIYKPLFGLR